MKTTLWIFVLLIIVLGIYSIVQTPFLQNPQQAQLERPNRDMVIAAISAEDNGPLQECTVNNGTYYFARGSMFDGSDNVYDARGIQIAQCGGGWGVRPDPYPSICEQLYTAMCTDVTQSQ